MFVHIHDGNIHANHFKVDDNGDLVTTGHEQLEHIVGVTSYTVSANTESQVVAIDTGSGAFTLTLEDPTKLNENGVVKSVRIVNIGDLLTQNGVNDKEIIVQIEGNGEFFQNLKDMLIPPNEALEFTLYKAVISGTTIAKWSLRSRVEYKTWVGKDTATVTSNNTDVGLQIRSEDFNGLITEDGSGGLVFNFDGQVEITTQYRVDPLLTDGSYQHVSVTDSLNGVSIVGSNKYNVLKQDSGNFILAQNERYIFRVKSGYKLTTKTTDGFTGRAQLVNYQMLIKSYL